MTGPLACGRRPRRRCAPRAFTIVEILIVVVLLGIIALITIPHFLTAQEDTTAAAFVSNLHHAAQAFRRYRADYGEYPDDRGPAELPPGMDEYLRAMSWDRPTTIGGHWEWDYLQYGYTAGVSVHQPDRTDAHMSKIDKMVDDGDLTTGAFRKRVNGYIYVIEY
jgi:prepilin-type N-terminal cleavage/methylation domain-containing protein